MRTVVSGFFDPVTEKELMEMKKIRKEKKDLYVFVKEEGIASRKDRERMVSLALSPYRHLHITQDLKNDDEVIDLQMEEELCRNGHFRLAAKGVRKYLLEHNLYLSEVVNALCNAHRAVHSLSVADVCRELAITHHLDGDLAYRMGAFHDVTKKWSREEGEPVMERWFPEWVSVSDKVWHSFTALVYLKQEMGEYNPVILNAIRHHTLGDGSSDYDHILYIADKCEPTRGYDAEKEMTLAKKSLKEAAALVKEESKAYIYEKEGVHV